MKYFVDDWNSVWKYVPVERNLASEADVFLLWQDVTSGYTEFIQDIHNMGKKVIVLQHGRHATSDYVLPPVAKPMCDKMLVWGDSDVRRLESIGFNNYVKVGCPLFQALPKRKKHEGKIIAYCPGHWAIEHNENLLVAKEMSKNKDWKVISKLLPIHLEGSYDNPVMSHHTDEDHLDKVFKVLAQADVIVGFEDGTFEMLGMAMGIPVVALTDMEPFEFHGKIHNGKGHLSPGVRVHSMKNLDTLNEVIQDTIDNPDVLAKERMETLIDDGGYGMDAITNIMREIQTV